MYKKINNGWKLYQQNKVGQQPITLSLIQSNLTQTIILHDSELWEEIRVSGKNKKKKKLMGWRCKPYTEN